MTNAKHDAASGQPDAKVQTNANAGQNQNAGKGAPPRNLAPGKDGKRPEKREPQNPEEILSDGKATEGKHEDAALVKEVIRSRDA